MLKTDLVTFAWCFGAVFILIGMPVALMISTGLGWWLAIGGSFIIALFLYHQLPSNPFI